MEHGPASFRQGRSLRGRAPLTNSVPGADLSSVAPVPSPIAGPPNSVRHRRVARRSRARYSPAASERARATHLLDDNHDIRTVTPATSLVRFVSRCALRPACSPTSGGVTVRGWLRPLGVRPLGEKMREERARLYFMCGKMAAGKSTHARGLARAKNAVLLVQDEFLVALYPGEIRNIQDFVKYSARVRDALALHVRDLLSRGVSVVLDFPGNTRAQRQMVSTSFVMSGPDQAFQTGG